VGFAAFPAVRVQPADHRPRSHRAVPRRTRFLVMGWSLRAVKALRVTFNQNAVLWMGKDAVPKLVLL
jgi:hypothetical protein